MGCLYGADSHVNMEGGSSFLDAIRDYTEVAMYRRFSENMRPYYEQRGKGVKDNKNVDSDLQHLVYATLQNERIRSWVTDAQLDSVLKRLLRRHSDLLWRNNPRLTRIVFDEAYKRGVLHAHRIMKKGGISNNVFHALMNSSSCPNITNDVKRKIIPLIRRYGTPELLREKNKSGATPAAILLAQKSGTRKTFMDCLQAIIDAGGFIDIEPKKAFAKQKELTYAHLKKLDTSPMKDVHIRFSVRMALRKLEYEERFHDKTKTPSFATLQRTLKETRM